MSSQQDAAGRAWLFVRAGRLGADLTMRLLAVTATVIALILPGSMTRDTFAQESPTVPWIFNNRGVGMSSIELNYATFMVSMGCADRIRVYGLPTDDGYGKWLPFFEGNHSMGFVMVDGEHLFLTDVTLVSSHGSDLIIDIDVRPDRPVTTDRPFIEHFRSGRHMQIFINRYPAFAMYLKGTDAAYRKLLTACAKPGHLS